MIKKKKNLIFFLIFVLFTNCSLDNKTGIWSGTEKEKKRIADLERQATQIKEVVKIYSSKKFYTEEIKPVNKIKLSTPKKNLSWKMPGLNEQNFIGNIFLAGIDNNFLKKKIGKNKFSISKLISSPVILNDNIIFADDTGTIFNINQRGKKIWKKNIYKKFYKRIYKSLTFTIHKNKIYVADNIGFVYAINLQNGKLIWIKNHRVPLRSNIKIYDDKIFLINQDNRIFCLDPDTGSIIWDARSISTFIKSQSFLGMAISKGGDLITLNSSGDLVKIKSKTGQFYWSLNTTGTILASENDFFQSSDIVIDDENIIFSTTSSVSSYNINSGYLNWIKDIGSTNTPIIDGNHVFVISDNGYFVNLDKNSGEIIWSTNILKILKKKKQKTKITGFVMGSKKIYVTTLNGYLLICSASLGNVEDFKKIGNTITASPVISNGSLYILTENSKIYGFR